MRALSMLHSEKYDQPLSAGPDLSGTSATDWPWSDSADQYRDNC